MREILATQGRDPRSVTREDLDAYKQNMVISSASERDAWNRAIEAKKKARHARRIGL
ncbi:MAG: hypothetical protein AB7F19_07595 [Candidatus Babeliales bacterium]